MNFDMDCLDNSCWILSPPSLPPPPPLPKFLAYLNLTIDCDLCAWAGVKAGSTEVIEPNVIQLSSLLIIVGVLSAGCGAGIMAAILSIKRMRNNSATSVRHLARKESTRNRSVVSGSGGFSAAQFSENTYCDAPYSNSTGIDKDLSNNIYAELQEPNRPDLWARPRISAQIENCYLELNDVPIAAAIHPPVLATKSIPPWFLDESQSPNSSTYYSDFEVSKNCSGKSTASVHYHQ